MSFDVERYGKRCQAAIGGRERFAAFDRKSQIEAVVDLVILANAMSIAAASRVVSGTNSSRAIGNASIAG